MFLWIEREMAAAQLTGSLISAKNLPSFNGLRPSAVKFSPSIAHMIVGGRANRSYTGLVVRAATVVAPKVSQHPFFYTLSSSLSFLFHTRICLLYLQI